MKESPPDLLTVQEAATALRRSDRTIERWLAQGLLPSVRVGKGRYLRRSDVEDMQAVQDNASLAAQAEPLTDAQLALVRRALTDALQSLTVANRAG